MKVYKFSPPYKNGKCTFKNAWNKSGVYIIKENNKIVYIGQSGYNLYKTMYRHFQSWDSHQARATYNKDNKRKKYSVRMIFCTPQKAEKLEVALCKKYNPRDMKYKYTHTPKDNKITKVEKEYFVKPVNHVPF